MKSASDDLLRMAASLYYLDGLDEHSVADFLGVSRPTVSRLLAQARSRGIVRVSVEEFEPRHRELEEQIKKRYPVNNVVVIKPVVVGSRGDIRKTLGYFSAPLVTQWIPHGSIVGIAGGRALAELVRSLPQTSEPKNITTVQLMGNIGPTVSSVDAVELSRIFVARFGGSFYTLNAPAITPDAETRTTFLAHEHIRSVWHLFEQMNTALVGVGTLSDSAFIERGVLDEGRLISLRTMGAVGEICGRFFDKYGDECKSEMQQCVISIPLLALRAVREVIGVTAGAERAAAVVAALRGGLLKSVIIDESCARAVLGLSE